MKKLILFPLILLLLQSCDDPKDVYGYGQNSYTIDWNAAADSSSMALIDQFWNPTDHYFNYGSDGSLLDFHYWPNAHAMDVIIDAYVRTNDAKYKAYFDQWYAGVKVKNGNTYYNDFYDDMEWNALTMLRLYDITKDEKYLTTVKQLWADIETGWNDKAGGGIAWVKYQLYSKNACSNGPAAIIAARLYQLTKEESYKQWALDIYDWEKNTLYNQSTGAVYDNINGDTGVIADFSLTYNQGTFIGAAVELYKITGNIVYINDAQKAANFTIIKLIDTSNNILRDEGDGDNGLFKGIFMRYFLQLILTDGVDPSFKNKYVTFFNNNADVLWRKGCYKENLLFGTSWNNPPVGATQLTSQASACMMIEAKALFEKSK
ncbi:glycoside hydrolase family 76 protein [Dysgonomonas sp. HDW5B]|uniref:glycoside hydrolase family 76 protein n=1 Tax=Dysgonomonas sp. HDW5B TaxID=2714927 RepID=UPI00140BEA8F|nr:glycoside hydrolase family 76 protein [Dysgonomonas sp. HDW5B]QIK53169.1 glycoside hydrolase family 76 protein [Dysgonomonas sp. HDW5B]